jgi:L-threonylcarbamoyladenylate synthase
MTSVITPTELQRQVQAAIETLHHGGVAAFPTDTLYGLGADYASPSAVQRVIDIKGRSSAAGLPLLLSGVGQLPLVTRDIPETVWPLVERFWPGPLTLIVSRSVNVSDLVTGGRSTVAVRVPDHPVAQALAQGLGRPITGTSANLTGHPPATSAGEVRDQLGGSLDLIVDGGESPLGLPSTILDVTGPGLKIVRIGAVSLSYIQQMYPEEVRFSTA